MAITVAAPGPRTRSSGPFPDLTSVDVDALEELWVFLEEAHAAMVARRGERPDYWRTLEAGLAAAMRSVYVELLRRSPRTLAARTLAPETELERAAAWGY